ncbi:MAG: NAD(P)/FAD-dependent oxidoreductase [Candidatus Parcubacteria bacterium]|nr:NAD(P)/FAD-dependent oxidoreductase [Burkholderiales bacterium]
MSPGERNAREVHEPGEVRKLLGEADIVPLTLALVHLTGDHSLLDAIAPHVKGPWAHQARLPQALADSIRDRLAGELAGNGCGVPVTELPASALQHMMSVGVGEPVHEQYVPMLVENMLQTPRVEVADVAAAHGTFKVAVIGAGASGLCAAIRLRQAGVACIVFEKNDQVGGTWYENRYPGCAVDTPNHFYQYSFEPNDDWPHYFSRQKTILGYLSMCADKYRVRESIRFGCEVESASYDEAARAWTVVARERGGERREHRVNAVICAVGQLNRPSIPKIPGLESFKGQVLHTATWPEDTDLSGKRVALVGSGASAVQLGPAIVDRVASLHVFQRSAAWVGRQVNIDSRVSEGKKWALRNVPYYAEWYRVQLFWAFGDGLHAALKIDPQWQGGNESINPKNAALREAMVRHIRRELEGRDDLVARLIPDYPPFGKRVLADAGWYRMFRREHVTLVESRIERIDADSIHTSDGGQVPVDAIVFATGFQAGRMLWPMEIRGRGGVSIRELWGEDNPRAYLGIAVPRFPNLFLLYGPNTNLGHGGSAIFLAECQVHYILGLVQQLRREGGGTAEIRADVHDRYNELIDAELKQLSWSHPSVRTWYKNSAGRIVTNQPWTLVEYWRLTREPRLSEFILN